MNNLAGDPLFRVQSERVRCPGNTAKSKQNWPGCFTEGNEGNEELRLGAGDGKPMDEGAEQTARQDAALLAGETPAATYAQNASLSFRFAICNCRLSGCVRRGSKSASSPTLTILDRCAQKGGWPLDCT